MKLRFCQKSKDDILSQNTFKDGIPGITQKDDIYCGKHDIRILY